MTRRIVDSLAATLAHEGITVHRLTEPAVSGKVYAWTCPECGTFVSTFVRLADPPSADEHADCGTACACYDRGVHDEWEATRP